MISNLQFMEMHPHTITEPPPKATVSWMFRGAIAVFLCLQTRVRPSTMCSKNRLSSEKWTFLQEAMFQCKRSLHQASRAALWAGDSLGRLIGLLARYPAAFRRFRTVLFEMGLPGSHSCLNRELESKDLRRTSLSKALSSRTVVFLGLPGLGRSLTSLVARYFFKSFEIMEWCRPIWVPICLRDIPAFLMPIICQRVASDNFLRAMTLKWMKNRMQSTTCACKHPREKVHFSKVEVKAMHVRCASFTRVISTHEKLMLYVNTSKLNNQSSKLLR